ncbi:MAG: hypothetical protein ACLFU7_01230 [Armatimonadota bacterium]
MAIDPRQPRRAEKRWGPAAVAVLLAVGATGLLALTCIRTTGGALVYALDDAYIHLAMGRTLAESGIWGLNAATPGAASSSPLWTLLLAGMTAVFGAQTWFALALNALAAALLALVADLWLRQLSFRPAWRLSAVVAVLVVGPVGPLAMTGMEHVAHAGAVVLLVALALRRSPAGPIALALAAALATGFRYESAFVAAALAVMMAMRRDWGRAVGLFIGPTFVVGVVGVVQTAIGQGFLPNSLIVKAASFTSTGLGEWLRGKAFGAIEHAFEAPVVALPLLAIAIAWAAASRVPPDEDPPMTVRVALQSAAALSLAMLLQLTLARTGWYHRYEAYLLIWGTLSVFASARAWQAVGGRRLARGEWRNVAIVGAGAAGLLLVLALGLRIQAWQTAPEACLDIATQHGQMARFVERYYQGEPLVLNDVGYVSYVSDGAILDLGGLGSHAVAKVRSEGRYSAEWVARAAEVHGARIAINYDISVIPDRWDKVASWNTGAVRVAGSDTVNFYALDASAREELRANLRAFEGTLPQRVSVEYYAPEP